MYLFLPKGVLKRIQSLFAKFLWGGSLDSNCIYNVAWSDCCFPKEEGGLGIRDLTEWNTAAILYQVWRLSLPSVSSLWLLWVHSCMLKRKHFWTAKIPYKCPWNLRKIFNMRSLALQYITFKVKVGSLFNFWHDPWLTKPPLIVRFGEGIISTMDSSANATVGSMCSDGTWEVSLSNDYRAIAIRQLLSSVSFDSKDMVLWHNDCNVNLRVIWDSIRRRSTPPSWQPLIWNRFHIPSHSFISWLACRDRLSTKDRLQHFLHNVDPVCVLCRSYNESSSHIFSTCPYTYLIIRGSPFALKLAWEDWMRGDFFQDSLSQFNKEMGFLYITIIIYHVWKERNSRVFGKGSMPVDKLHYFIKRTFREKLFSCHAFRRKLNGDPSLSQILY